MSLLTIQAVSKSYFGRVILDGVALQLDRGERLALIGNNGTGKTTLLRLIMGLEKPDSGQIVIAGQAVPGYLPQHLTDDQAAMPLVSPELQQLESAIRQLEEQMARQTQPAEQQALLRRYTDLTARFDLLGGYSFRHRMQEMLAGLGLIGEQLERRLSTLSGGERMRVALARLLLCEPDILLLDEPTNHMDLAAMEWLETYLKAFKGAVLIISHDRTFLDRTATMTAELTAGALKVRPGTYSRFLEIEAAEQLTLARERKKLARELEHQQQAVQTLLSHRKMSSYHAREKVVARLTGQLSEIAARAQRPGRPLSFRFLPGLTDGDPKRVLLAVDDLTGGYTAEPLFSRVSFLLRGRSKTALCGPNGCGKTTLLALLLGRFDAFTGQVRLAEKAVFGHMGQHVDFADETMTVLDELRRRSELPEGAARDLLARYGFRDVDVFKTLSVLSGGERARLYLACLLLEQPSLLLLDEPTNHLDIASREILEQALIDFNGAVLAVSHDRYFIDHCCSDILGFVGDQVLPFASFEAYRQEARRYEERMSDGERAPAAESTRQQASRINRAGERRETALRKEHLRQLEKQIREHEDEKTALETGFADDTRPETYHRYERILTDLERLYAQYIDLAESET